MTSRRLLFLFLSLTLSFAVPAGVVRADDEVASDDAKPAPKKKKTPKKKKGFDYDASRYKSIDAGGTASTYKFNEKAEPIVSTKKKPAVKKKKRSEPPEVSPESCGSEDSCAERKSEADAL